jgi:hypothetical protein
MLAFRLEGALQIGKALLYLIHQIHNTRNICITKALHRVSSQMKPGGL